ncbi:unnamed protein product [Didymodactylos carnosus]|uniref:Uncharacterized protein n=1 Tax=Didymodactylos carnosus TaxID=1234261 RepID=A0A815EYG4_9BILA|nr:unnamed protein product [Didymodactylos carnosus]CAF4151133.1 unnamed protein product [Didymodactylos carnosus]
MTSCSLGLMIAWTDPHRTLAHRKFYENLKQETAHNHTNPCNILTQNYIGVPDEVRVILPTNANLKRDIRRWRQDDNFTTIPIDKNFKSIPDKYKRTTTLWTFLDKLIKEENNLHSDIVNARSGREPTIQQQYESLNKRLHSLVKNPHPTIYDQLQAIGRLL